MATGLSTTLRGGSEECFDTYCSPCFDNGIPKEAVKYCLDCCVNYCEPCLKTHNKIPLCKIHQIVDKSEQGVRSAQKALPTEQCVIHKGKLADMFCKDHDTVCCAACIAINHRLCVKVDYLPDLAKGIKTSQEYRGIKNNLDELLKKLSKEKTKRLENLSSLEKEKNKADEEINKVEEELNKKITELAKQARTELQAKYNEERKVIEDDINNVEGVIIKVTSGKNKLKDGNDVQHFLNFKADKTIIKDGQTLLSSLSKTGKKRCLTFSSRLAHQLNSLGSICITNDDSEKASAEVQEYRAKLQGKYTVNDTRCDVTSVCIMDDATVFNMIHDGTNTYLKKVNMTDFKVVDQLQMEDYSCSFCRTGSREVAVAVCYMRKIQFVSVAGTMTLTRSFCTDHDCCGIAFNEITGELFVSDNGNQVNVYDKTGNMLKSYVIDDKGKPLFNKAGSIAFTDDKSTIFITDWDNGLIALDISSSLRWQYSDNELKCANDVCVLPGNVILLSGFRSNNVMQVDKHGKKVGILLGAGDNLHHPRALAYHRKSSRLIVAQDTNQINVYKLSLK